MYDLKVSINDIMDLFDQSTKREGRVRVRKAYEFALKKHAGMRRGTGEPFINHPMRVARFIANIGFESDVIAAALLHDVVEDCGVSISEIAQICGDSCACIVDAVTSLSDKDFSGHELSKAQLDILSDAKLQKKMNEKALYVKIADRIDNLNTMSGVDESKRIPKAEHTREIIIPMAMMQKAYRLVRILEELCFQVEHPAKYRQIEETYARVLKANHRWISLSKETLNNAFGANPYLLPEELQSCHARVKQFVVENRTFSGIFRQISREAANINRDMTAAIEKKQVEFFDMTLVVSNPPKDALDKDDPMEVFFTFFDLYLSKKGFCLLGTGEDPSTESVYLILCDQMDNRYRVYVKTEREYQRYLYGNIIDTEKSFRPIEVNEIDPTESYNTKIRVFRRDGSATMIDKGATVLDFAFHIHTDLGLHFDYAKIDESKARLPAYTKLNEGDTITIMKNDEIEPQISWFKYVKTSRAVHDLVRYFAGKMKEAGA